KASEPRLGIRSPGNGPAKCWAFFDKSRVHASNETQDQPRLSGTQVAAHGSTLATLDIQENDAVSAVGYSGPIRRFHLCSGEKHADSDRALPTGVCLLSISRPPGERS